MKRFALVVVGLVIALAVASYAFPEARGRVATWFASAPGVASLQKAEPVEASVDELYTWVDKQGIRHYSQKPAHKKAEKVTYDGSKVTPLPEADAAMVAKVKAIADTVKTNDKEEGEDAESPQGSQTIHNLRRELQSNQRKMQEAKNGRQNDL